MSNDSDYWKQHPPGTVCACIDCVERWGLIPDPPSCVKSRNPYPMLLFPEEWEDEWKGVE